MTALVLIFSAIVIGVIVLTFRTSGRLDQSRKAIEELRKKIEP